MLTKKHILLGISGGIAAYKMPDLVHALTKAGHDVKVILTKSAESFVSPLVLATLTKNKVWREEDFLAPSYGYQIPHISLVEWADLFVLCPATANTLHVAATGDASTLLGSTFVANTKPVLIFPAMNCNMLAKETVQNDIATLKQRGATVVDPDAGLLACGYEGKGRLPAKNVLLDFINYALTEKDLSGKKIVVTAGPTHEYIDPVRFISNPSSGKMGYALAMAARARGAEVTLISGHVDIVPPADIHIISITSAKEMLDATLSCANDYNVMIKAAAVGDYSCKQVATQKIKRESKGGFSLQLKENQDVAAELGKIKKQNQILVGFAAETNDVMQNAKKKLASKNLDMIVANDVTAQNAGFATDTNTVHIITKNAPATEVTGTKLEVANTILDNIKALF